MNLCRSHSHGVRACFPSSQNKTSDSVDGYDSVQIRAGERKAKRLIKPLMRHYAKFGVDEAPPYVVREFRVTTKDAMPAPGSRIHARHLIPGQNIDVSGISKGKGFQGGMKRHGFKGMPASHGTSKSHWAIGSTVSFFRRSMAWPSDICP